MAYVTARALAAGIVIAIVEVLGIATAIVIGIMRLAIDLKVVLRSDVLLGRRKLNVFSSCQQP